MNKKDLEAKLPLIDKAYQEAMLEAHRLEGEFRALSNLIKEWPETKELVNAETEPSSNLRDKRAK